MATATRPRNGVAIRLGAAPSYGVPERAFLRVDYREPHRERGQRLLAAHPEVRALFGPARWTSLFVFGLVALQLGLAWALRSSPIWLVLLVAYTIGAIAGHGLWVLIHEATHDLVFKSKTANQLLGLCANLPIVFPSASAFRKYHLLHHAWLGTHDGDPDLAWPAEARLVGSSPWRKALWLSLTFLAQPLRVPRIHRAKLMDGWYVANVAVQLAFVLLVWTLAGPTALAYLVAASIFSIGLHPVGARWIQEHYVVAPPQETYSYYGPLNHVAFNMGYHNEHHDLMRVAWFRLPRVKRIAPEFYEPLVSHRSWTRLLLRFIFDRDLTLYSRVIRDASVQRPPRASGQRPVAHESAARQPSSA